MKSLPKTFSVMVRRLAGDRWYHLSLHASDGLDCVEKVEALFPGVDTSRFRALLSGQRKPGVGITGNVSIIDTDAYVASNPGRRKTVASCNASITVTLGIIASEIGEIDSRAAQREDNGLPPVAVHVAARETLGCWLLPRASSNRFAKSTTLGGDGLKLSPFTLTERSCYEI